MRRITVVSTSRADYGLYRPLLRRLADDASVDLGLVVGGTHLAQEFGMTVGEIEADGFAIAERVELLSGEDTPRAVAEAMGRGTAGFAGAIARLAPDIVVVLGDRFEMHAAAVAAQPFRVPVAHIHGGELTLGAMDDAFRHSITKLSHLHFVAAEAFARRLRQMGEEDWRITVSGALGLDNLALIEPLAGADLEALIGLPPEAPPLIVTHHPETLGAEPVDAQAAALLGAVEDADLPVVITAPNADPGGARIKELVAAFVADHPRARYVENLGTRAYFGLMARAAAMVGNSSSGIIEAASFTLPVVNVGRRQEGRPRPANVIDVAGSRKAILAGIRRAVSDEFRAGLAGLRNPYAGDRPAAGTIHQRLVSVPLDADLLVKRFADQPPPD